MSLVKLQAGRSLHLYAHNGLGLDAEQVAERLDVDTVRACFGGRGKWKVFERLAAALDREFMPISITSRKGAA